VKDRVTGVERVYRAGRTRSPAARGETRERHLWHTTLVSIDRGSCSTVARWLVLILSWVVLHPRSAAADSEDTDDSDGVRLTASTMSSRGDALIVGSSSMNQALGRLIEHELARLGYRVTRKAVSAAGLARPDYRDMNQILEELPISASTAAVFIYIGMNDAQSIWLRPGEQLAFGRTYLPWTDARWQGLYVQRAQEFFERICERGAQRAIVLLPVDVKRERLQTRLKRIRELQAQAASSSSCAVALSTAGDLGRFDSAGNSLRKRDGLHMSTRGAHAVWRRIQAEALHLVGTPEARPEQRGPWCSPSCRLGQGLRFRPESRAATHEALARLTGASPSSDCTVW
jgi:lysophospholipase L1-like esterase